MGRRRRVGQLGKTVAPSIVGVGKLALLLSISFQIVDYIRRLINAPRGIVPVYDQGSQGGNVRGGLTSSGEPAGLVISVHYPRIQGIAHRPGTVCPHQLGLYPPILGRRPPVAVVLDTIDVIVRSSAHCQHTGAFAFRRYAHVMMGCRLAYALCSGDQHLHPRRRGLTAGLVDTQPVIPVRWSNKVNGFIGDMAGAATLRGRAHTYILSGRDVVQVNSEIAGSAGPTVLPAQGCAQFSILLEPYGIVPGTAKIMPPGCTLFEGAIPSALGIVAGGIDPDNPGIYRAFKGVQRMVRLHASSIARSAYSVSYRVIDNVHPDKRRALVFALVGHPENGVLQLRITPGVGYVKFHARS